MDKMSGVNRRKFLWTIGTMSSMASLGGVSFAFENKAVPHVDVSAQLGQRDGFTTVAATSTSKGFPTLPEELAAYKGIECYRTIESKYLKPLRNQQWSAIANKLLTMDKPATKYTYTPVSSWAFSVAPGSGAHHRHYGGLALHTLQNLDYAAAWAEVYQARGIIVDRDLLSATIIVHDAMKRFIYKFDENFNFIKKEDPFIAKNEDHHSWVLRELTARGADRELVLSVAAIHGIDDVTLDQGVKSVAVVNHYLRIGNTGLEYTADDVRPEHVIAFLSDSDWHWSGQAQRKTEVLAKQLAPRYELSPEYLQLYLGSRFTYERVGDYIDKNGYAKAADIVSGLIGSNPKTALRDHAVDASNS
jgi:hypothetical protein